MHFKANIRIKNQNHVVMRSTFGLLPTDVVWMGYCDNSCQETTYDFCNLVQW